MSEEFNLSEKMKYWKDFLLSSNDEIHTVKKGVLMAECLIMNNFIVDWFNDLEKDVKEFIKRLKEKNTWLFLCPFCGRRLNQEDRIMNRDKRYFCQDCQKEVIARELWVVDVKEIDKLAGDELSGSENKKEKK